MNNGNVDTKPLTNGGWFAIALLTVIIGIEFAFPSWSAAQMYALAAAGVFFGSIIAWRSFR